jgi:hypothetical protein
MKKVSTHFAVIALVAIVLVSCKKKNTDDIAASLDKFVLGTNISSGNPIIGYIGTLKDLNQPNFTNTKARQFTQYPELKIYKDFVFALPTLSGDVVRKYKRETDGTLSDQGSLTMPAGSVPVNMVVESDTKAYIALWRNGKIAVVNPTTMQQTGVIDITSYGLSDGNPDPSIMLLRNGSLYVCCTQTSNGFTSVHPVQILKIDLATNAITSITDARSTWAGSINEQNSLFVDELGDIYVFCVASYGFGGPTQKSGFLRIKAGQNTFDPTYFFNVSDYNITGIPGSKVDYLQKMEYAGNGILYSTGNIYALASNPPNYVTDRTYGSFKVDIRNQSISKINLPYSNGYAASVKLFNNNVYFGLATTTGVGIYEYNPATNTAGTAPKVNTQGDPSFIGVFQ